LSSSSCRALAKKRPSGEARGRLPASSRRDTPVLMPVLEGDAVWTPALEGDAVWMPVLEGHRLLELDGGGDGALRLDGTAGEARTWSPGGRGEPLADRPEDDDDG
jgi:hypothetical protein